MAVTPQVLRVASATDLQTQVNAYLSTLFGASSVLVLGVTIDSRANAPFFNANFVASITTNPTGAAVQAAPFQFVTFTAPIEADVLKLCNAFIAANPAFFFSQVFAIYRPDEPNPVQGVTLGLFFCSDAANAAANWASISSGSRGTAVVPDAPVITPNVTTSAMIVWTTTQNFTLANPTGTPTDGLSLIVRVKSAAPFTITYGAQFFQSGTSLNPPLVTSGGGRYDYIAFMWNADRATWDCVATALGQ